MRKPDVGVGNGGDWDASRGCIVDSCSNDTITTSYEASEWEVLPCYFYDGLRPYKVTLLLMEQELSLIALTLHLTLIRLALITMIQRHLQ